MERPSVPLEPHVIIQTPSMGHAQNEIEKNSGVQTNLVVTPPQDRGANNMDRINENLVGPPLQSSTPVFNVEITQLAADVGQLKETTTNSFNTTAFGI